MRKYRGILSIKQIEEAQKLRIKFGYTKRELAIHFEVGATTIWDNVFRNKKRGRNFVERVCKPCIKCEICLTKEVSGSFIPMNYQIGEMCIICHLRSHKLNFKETFKDVLDME